MRISSLLFAIIIIAALMCSAAHAQSWNSFGQATFLGVSVDVTPDWATNTFHNKVTLNPGATVNVDGDTYQVAWLSGFFVNSVFKTDGFSAQDALGSSVWSWRQSPVQEPPFNSVGWICSGNNDRLHADVGGEMTYDLVSSDIWMVPTVNGFHVGYYDNEGRVKTEFLSGIGRPTLEAPEPSSLYGGLALLSGMATMIGRNMRRRKTISG